MEGEGVVSNATQESLPNTNASQEPLTDAKETSEVITPSPYITGEVRGEGLYDGIPYPTIIEALEDQLGGVPAHGSRNQFIFSMACQLRYICNDDPEWIAQVLPIALF